MANFARRMQRQNIQAKKKGGRQVSHHPSASQKVRNAVVRRPEGWGSKNR